ncbi:hypothetical protein OHA74_29985 [Streptomyces phaeochromogenes]|uniref:hypothetical protein n=1 Tax=Streptomyces phaeochromogenes TaxID=1923 RepID=UPI002E2C45B5|nr:hypothetical protein [Streptomyces phaeochromogenes]
MSNDDIGPDENSLTAKLQAWLALQGYPLEMRVAREFRKKGIRVTSSDCYMDIESGDHREIDVTARIPLCDLANLDGKAPSFLCPVIECKSAPGKPWILFEGANLHPVASVAQRFVLNAAQHHWGRYAREINPTETPLAEILPLFNIGDDPAYSAVRSSLGKNREDAAYGTMTSVTKAAYAVANMYPHKGNLAMHVAVPIIVVDSPVFSCKLSESGEVILEPIERGTIVWKKGVSKEYSLHSIITIVSESALPTLCDDIAKTASHLRRSLPPWASQR